MSRRTGPGLVGAGVVVLFAFTVFGGCDNSPSVVEPATSPEMEVTPSATKSPKNPKPPAQPESEVPFADIAADLQSSADAVRMRFHRTLLRLATLVHRLQQGQLDELLASDGEA